MQTAPQALASADSSLASGDLDAAIAHLCTALRLLEGSGDVRAASSVAVRLGQLFSDVLGNLPAGRAWFSRARRLVEHEEPCVEQGWAALGPLGCDVDDPEVLLAAAEYALPLARQFGDVQLEAKALADAGLAHVQAGRTQQGMELLDEAMALACGPAAEESEVGRSVCSFFTACYFAADFGRAGNWSDLMRRRGVIGDRSESAIFVTAHCESVRAALLIELGRWGEAEAILEKANAEFEEKMGVPGWHPAIELAGLRVQQGRLGEAEALLLGKEQAMQALIPATRLHLARGDLDIARAAARRGLRALGSDRLRAAELLGLLVDIELATGDLEAAERAGQELGARLDGLSVTPLLARVSGVEARLAAARGKLEEAARLLESAVDGLDPAELPWLRASLQLQLVGLRETTDPAAARLEARAVARTLEALDVALPPPQAELLARLAPSGPSLPPVRLVWSYGRWSVRARGATAKLPTTKGIRLLAELLATPGRERHVFDLTDALEGTSPGEVDRRSLGDAGEVLDSEARRSYRRRIEALRLEIDEALDRGADMKAQELQNELDQLVRALAAAFGLGGRSRRVASSAERARLNVTRALRTAVARLAEELPEEAAQLGRSLRTGIYCAYEPGDDASRWVFIKE